MRIEKINENKIKVLIDTDEAREWNVDVKTMASGSPEMQDMFRTAIKLAERDVKFSIDGAKLFIEAIPGKINGFGMLITKVFSDSDLNRAMENCSYKGSMKKSILKAGPIKKPTGKRIFRFDDFENVCYAAEAIFDSYIGSSTLYKLDDEYYMLLEPGDRVTMYDTERIMLEFSQKVERTLLNHGRLNELADVMIKDNAIEILKEYFV